MPLAAQIVLSDAAIEKRVVDVGRVRRSCYASGKRLELDPVGGDADGGVRL